MKRIKTWYERCEEHPDHQERIITERMIQERMQEEIDELRQALETEPEALRLADALDAEFVQGRISNSTGRESAVELRRLALKQWVGLTDEEIQEVVSKKWWDWEDAFDIEGFSRAIEAKLKEKNHG